jgi:hypothetical protein
MEACAVGAEHIAAHLVDQPDGDVARDDGIRHTGESTMPQMNVGAAHLREHRAEQHTAAFEVRFWEFA